MERSLLKTLNLESEEIQPNVILHILNIEKIEKSLKNYMDQTLIEIFSKGNDSNINIVKSKLKKYFDSKKNTTLEIGSIAEFFIHLFLNLKNFKQECLYENLEENAPKKGFDGLYTKDCETWIMESKSGSIITKDISHQSKIQEAYKDLSNKFSGKSNNNPWQNAYFHAKIANSEKDLLSSIKALEDMYTKGKYALIDNHNIIPCSTIFYDTSKFNHIDINLLKPKIKSFLNGKMFKKINLICINKKTKNLFLDYIHNKDGKRN